MLELRTLRDNVLADLRENLSEDDIRACSVRDVLDACLQWQGIIGYADYILTTLQNLQDSEVKPKPDVVKELPRDCPMCGNVAGCGQDERGVCLDCQRHGR